MNRDYLLFPIQYLTDDIQIVSMACLEEGDVTNSPLLALTAVKVSIIQIKIGMEANFLCTQKKANNLPWRNFEHLLCIW